MRSVVYEPNGQELQSEGDVLPAAEILPAGQFAHTVSSVKVEDAAPGRAYFPAGQETGPEQPGIESPVVEPYVPAGQVVHAAAPVADL
jgi:hypothetical protein